MTTPTAQKKEEPTPNKKMQENSRNDECSTSSGPCCGNHVSKCRPPRRRTTGTKTTICGDYDGVNEEPESISGDATMSTWLSAS